MGKGALNRLLLLTADADAAETPTDGTEASSNCVPAAEGTAHEEHYVLPPSDARARHIRTVLAPAAARRAAAAGPGADGSHGMELTLRVAVEQRFLHDAAAVTVLDDGSVRVTVPAHARVASRGGARVALLVAMQRPKVIARVIEAAAALGVCAIVVVAAEKVEKSYWDCKLFRDGSVTTGRDGADCDDDGDGDDEGEGAGASELPRANGSDGSPPRKRRAPALPGRARGPENHPHRDRTEAKHRPMRREVGRLPAVHRRLTAGVEQACADAVTPDVVLERGGLHCVVDEPAHPVWELVGANAARVVAHPYAVAETDADVDKETEMGTDGRERQQGLQSVVETVRARAARDGRGAVLAIGPEGGWTDDEVRLLARRGFVVCGMGERVLRSETAVVVGLGLVHEGLRLGREQLT